MLGFVGCFNNETDLWRSTLDDKLKLLESLRVK